MGGPAKKEATYTDLFDIPEDMIGEIISGELHTMPKPSPKHSMVVSSLVRFAGCKSLSIKGNPARIECCVIGKDRHDVERPTRCIDRIMHSVVRPRPLKCRHRSEMRLLPSPRVVTNAKGNTRAPVRVN